MQRITISRIRIRVRFILYPPYGKATDMQKGVKIKDYFDKNYIENLALQLQDAGAAIDASLFVKDALSAQDSAFGERLTAIAMAIDRHIPHYPTALTVMSKTFKEQLPSFAVMYSTGLRYAPFGKYVEIFAPRFPQYFDETVNFVELLTCRYTGEYAMRPVIEAFPEKSMTTLERWSMSDNAYIRRLSSECMRVGLPWAKKLTAAVSQWEKYVAVLDNLVCDYNPYVTRSVANNLNELYKYDKTLGGELTTHWQQKFGTKARSVIKHGTRWLRRSAKNGV